MNELIMLSVIGLMFLILMLALLLPSIFMPVFFIFILMFIAAGLVYGYLFEGGEMNVQ